MVDLTATAGSGGTLNWYSDAGLTTNIGSGTTLTPGATVGATIYYVAETVGTCESAAATVTITINANPTIDSEASTNPSSCGASDGTITITASGGTGAYTYSVDNGATFQAGNAFNTLSAGSYTVVIDDGNCQTTGSTIALSDPSAPAAPTAGTDATYCAGDAMADLTATAGSGGTLNWYSDAGLTTNIGSGTTLTPGATIGATLYYVTETLAGCESAASIVTITINALPSIDAEASTNPTICGASDGSITITASGGTGVGN